jgi:biotin operon repressor
MRRASTLAPHRPATDLLTLLGHGRANARTAADLASRIGLSERAVRGSVEYLRRDGHLIGSTTTDGGGFFLIQTWEELEATARQLRSRALSMLTTKRALEHAAAKQFGPEALRLFDLEEVG